MSIFAQGAFQIDPNSTPEQIRRKREAIAKLMPQFGKARYIGEGIGQLAYGIGSGMQERALDKQEEAGTAAAGDIYNGILSRVSSRAPSGGSTYSATAPSAPPSASQGLADDTMSALGKPAMGGGAYGIRQGLIDRGLPEHIADGFVMNFKDESGLDPGINERSPLVPGSRGGFGLAQWTGPRRKALESFAAQRGANVSDPNTQLDFLMTELQGPESRAAKAIFSAQDSGQAAAAIVNDFLRPAEQHRAAREARYTGGQSTQPTQAGGIPMADLYAAMANPWMSAEQRAVIGSMIQQQEQAADPLRRMNIEKAELELAQMRDGKGNVPSSVEALKWRAEQSGLVPGTPEYQSFILNEGGAPATFRALDMQAQAAGFKPGTPEYNEFMATRGAGFIAEARTTATNIAEAKTAEDAAAAAARGTVRGRTEGESIAAASSDVQAAQNALDLIESLRNDPARTTATGKSSFFNGIPGTKGYDFQQKVEQAKGGAFLAAINQMRGLGALSNNEGAAATAAITRMNTALTESAFLEALDDYEKIVRQGLDRAKAVQQGGDTTVAPPPAAPAGDIPTFNPQTGAWE